MKSLQVTDKVYMRTLMDRLKVEEDRLGQEQEDSNGKYEKIKLVFKKRDYHYKRFLKKEGLTELDKLRPENNKKGV